MPTERDETGSPPRSRTVWTALGAMAIIAGAALFWLGNNGTWFSERTDSAVSQSTTDSIARAEAAAASTAGAPFAGKEWPTLARSWFEIGPQITWMIILATLGLVIVRGIPWWVGLTLGVLVGTQVAAIDLTASHLDDLSDGIVSIENGAIMSTVGLGVATIGALIGTLEDRVRGKRSPPGATLA